MASRTRSVENAPERFSQSCKCVSVLKEAYAAKAGKTWNEDEPS